MTYIIYIGINRRLLQNPDPLRYGSIYSIINQWGEGNGGYLDTRGSGCEDNYLCVSTSESPDRLSEHSAYWKILSGVGKNDGDIVEGGDLIHLQNQYNEGNGGYLDTRGSGCEDNYLCVSTAYGKDRDQKSGLWRIVTYKNAPVRQDEDVYLHDEYRGNGGYLDTRGGGCEDNLLCVSTNQHYDRESGTSKWKFVLVE